MDVKRALIALVAVAAATVPAQAAAAPGKLTLAQHGMTFQGRLTGAAQRCAGHRSISLSFHYAGGGKLDLGKRRTTAAGRYAFKHVMFDGSGYVIARATAANGCAALASNRVQISGT